MELRDLARDRYRLRDGAGAEISLRRHRWPRIPRGAGARIALLQRAPVSHGSRYRLAHPGRARTCRSGEDRALSKRARGSARECRRQTRVGQLASVLLRSGAWRVWRGRLCSGGCRYISLAVQRRPSAAQSLGATHRPVSRAERRFGPRQSCVPAGTTVYRERCGAGGRNRAAGCAAARGWAGPGIRWRYHRRGVDWHSPARTLARTGGGLAHCSRSPRGVRTLLGPYLMPEREAKIVNKLGIHARPAAEIVKAAGKFKSNITIVRDDLEVNAKSIMGVMMLAAEYGATITLRATGEDAEGALDALCAVIANKFGES